MSRAFSKISASLLAISLLAGCSTLGGKEASVAPEGPQPLTRDAIIAALNGGLVGGRIGTGLSDGEKRKALEAEYRALENTPSGQRVAWAGDGSGRRGEVVAAQPYRVGSQDCRQYSQTVFTPAGSQTARGTACRDTGGSWELL
ncbi:hypothetical protein NGM99_02450 [Mesorhizobium sp. RP14(2022)]|uniref:Surface antigen domain-containing protein n=1 Tax=Mesorhizobium liriopis TaxID=2953882 RepID=A0ABT1C343_9HYPH|nr:hypothetical protein [Mesorhizobium liriopis]